MIKCWREQLHRLEEARCHCLKERSKGQFDCIPESYVLPEDYIVTKVNIGKALLQDSNNPLTLKIQFQEVRQSKFWLTGRKSWPIEEYEIQPCLMLTHVYIDKHVYTDKHYFQSWPLRSWLRFLCSHMVQNLWYLKRFANASMLLNTNYFWKVRLPCFIF